MVHPEVPLSPMDRYITPFASLHESAGKQSKRSNPGVFIFTTDTQRCSFPWGISFYQWSVKSLKAEFDLVIRALTIGELVHAFMVYVQTYARGDREAS
jgi:hypothetical protein